MRQRRGVEFAAEMSTRGLRWVPALLVHYARECSFSGGGYQHGSPRYRTPFLRAGRLSELEVLEDFRGIPKAAEIGASQPIFQLLYQRPLGRYYTSSRGLRMVRVVHCLALRRACAVELERGVAIKMRMPSSIRSSSSCSCRDI